MNRLLKLFCFTPICKWTFQSIGISILVLFFSFNLIGQEDHFFLTTNKKIDIEGFDKKVNSLIENSGVPGISLAIIEQNKVVYTKGYGHIELGKEKKVDKNTVFEACSLSKSLLAFVMHKLIDDKKLELDKPMYQYYEYNFDGINILHHDPRYKLITPRMALSHSTGLENWRWDFDEDKLEFVDTPGQCYKYSGEGYHYLSQIAEVILKEGYQDYCKRMLIEPLNLQNTYTGFPAELAASKNFAIGHTNYGEIIEKNTSDRYFPAGGVSITAEDYAKLIISFFDKKHFSSERMKSILEPLTPIQKNRNYGLGFEIFYTENDTLIGHGGSNDGFKALMFYSPIKKNGFVFMTNSDLGITLSSELSKMTIGLDIDPFYPPVSQYPSHSTRLFQTFKKDGIESLFTEIEAIKNDKNQELQITDMIDLMSIISNGTGSDVKIAMEKIANLCKNLNPNLPNIYYTLGVYYLDNGEFSLALPILLKAKELKSEQGELDDEIRYCKDELAKKNN